MAIKLSGVKEIFLKSRVERNAVKAAYDSMTMENIWSDVEKAESKNYNLDIESACQILDYAIYKNEKEIIDYVLVKMSRLSFNNNIEFKYILMLEDYDGCHYAFKKYFNEYIKANSITKYFVKLLNASIDTFLELDNFIIKNKEKFLDNALLANALLKVLYKKGVTADGLSLFREMYNRKTLNKSNLVFFDKLLIENRLFEEADEVLKVNLTHYAADNHYIIQNMISRDRATLFTKADYLQNNYLLNNEQDDRSASLVMKRYARTVDYDKSISLGESIMAAGSAGQATISELALAYQNKGMHSKAKKIIEEADSKHNISANEGSALVNYYGNLGDYDRALKQIKTIRDKGNVSKSIERNLNVWEEKIKVYKDTSYILSQFPVEEPEGVSIIVTRGSPLGHLWTGLTATELRKKNFATVFLFQDGICEVPKTGIEEIDSLHGLVEYSCLRLKDEPEGEIKTRYEWNIDIDKGVISACGYNFYQAICARIGTIFRSYRLDLNEPVAQAVIKEHVQIADAMLQVCERIKKVSEETKLPIRFLSTMSHYVPATVFRQFCHNFGDELNINYVSFVAAYQHYYTNLKNNKTTALSVCNNTKNKGITFPTRVTSEKLESWMRKQSNEDKAMYKEDILKVIGYDRAGKEVSGQLNEVTNKITEHKNSGGSVACLFGRILYDLWMDEPGGTAHNDIVDWINHSIELVKDSDTLLLIKPHPNEVKKKIADPAEYFLDLIEAEINENVIVCDHKWFNVSDLLPIIDLGILWNGTASLELQACGIPVLMAGQWGHKDHPVTFTKAVDREDYEYILKHPKEYSVSNELEERCLMLLKYYSTDEVMLPYNYGNMKFLRGGKVNIGPPCWYMNEVQDYIDNGDEYISRIAERCL